METYDSPQETDSDSNFYVAENGTTYKVISFPDSFFIPTRENARNTFWNEKEDTTTFGEISESCTYQLENFMHRNPDATEEQIREFKAYILSRFVED